MPLKTLTRWFTFKDLQRFLYALVASSLLLILVSCQGKQTFPKISPAELAKELSFQNDLIRASLETSLSEGKQLESRYSQLENQNSKLREDLDNERENLKLLEEKIVESGEGYNELEEELSSLREEKEGAEESYRKLRSVAQRTIDEVTQLKQKNENLVQEKIDLIQETTKLDGEIDRLSTELDDLRADFIRKSQGQGSRRAAPVKVAQPPKSKDGSETAEEKTKVVTVVKVEKAKPLDMVGVVKRTGEILKVRYDRVLQGRIVWDDLDIVLASLAGLIFLTCLFVGYRFISRRRLKRELDQYRKYYGNQGKTRKEPEPVEVHHFEVPPQPSQQVVMEEEDEFEPTQTIQIPIAGKTPNNQPAPEDFSPIYRSNSPAEEEVPMDALETIMVGQGDSEDADPAGNPRKVIGAYQDEGAPEVIEGSTSLTDQLDGGASQPSPGFDFSQTEMISGLDSFDEPEPSPPQSSKSTKSGSEDEKALLDELKSIINKKLET